MNLHEALEQIRQWIGDNQATSPYTKKGCRVSMANVPTNRVVLDVDLAFPLNTARCSYEGNLAQALAKSSKR